MATKRQLNNISRLFIASTLDGLGLENAFEETDLTTAEILYIQDKIIIFAEKMLKDDEQTFGSTAEVVDYVRRQF